VPLGGGAPRDVAEHIVEADWAPDGSSLAVIRTQQGKNTIEFPIGTSLYAAPFVSTPRISPAADLVAFADHPLVGDNRGDVAVVDRAGRKRALSRGWAEIRGIAWSPDGHEIWFTATRVGVELNLWAVTLDGKEREVYRAPGNLVLQQVRSDGRALLTVGRLRPRMMGRAPGEERDGDLSWLDWSWPADISRDGKTLLFAEQGDGGGPGYGTYVRGTDGSPPVLLGKGSAVALSPDGRLALVHNLTAPERLELVPTGAGDARPLPPGSLTQIHTAAFFPDGRRILISANEEGQPQRAFVQDLAGGDPRPIVSEGAGPAGFVGSDPITPDGLAFVARADSGLALHPTGGGAPRSVNGTGAGDVPLRFSADGRSLYVRGFERGQGNRVPARIYRIDLVTGTREPWREIVPPGAPGYATISPGIVIAPEANAYAYASFLPATTLYEVTGLR
jgi:dipeptidyl aminopeptidase/acylaminoacyl peptidase